MSNNRMYPQDRIIKSRVWKWITIIGTILGIVTAGWFLYDELSKDEFTIEQTVAPGVMKRLRELNPGETITVEKGRPADESRSPSD